MNTFRTPCWSYLMGTDHLGRDVLAQFIHGAQVSILVGALAAITATTLGVLIGMISGYWGGLIDDGLMRVTEFFQTVPKFFLMIIAVAIMGPSLVHLILVIGLLSWPQIARITRSEFLAIKNHEFVDAAHAIGASNFRILFRAILPNASPPIIVNGSLLVGQAILLEAYLSFLGLGDPINPSWGLMLYNAQQFVFQAWWMFIFPGAGIFVTVLCLNLFGDALNDVLNPLVSTSVPLTI
ncbi:MAG: ABC transporter permease [Candidatus Hodarchaeota archaeon]